MGKSPNTVTLVPVDEDNLKAVFELEVGPDQRHFVAPNPWSLAQALVDHSVAWPRAIVRDGEVVGFLMLEIDPDDEDGRPFWLWRMMVADGRQRRGIGTQAIALAIEEVRARGGSELYTSWVEGEGSPGAFYLRLGFVPTGEVDDGETVARLGL
jgi:diamine N-acetyltransferase